MQRCSWARPPGRFSTAVTSGSTSSTRAHPRAAAQSSICSGRSSFCCRSWPWFALPYVARSWAILERSREASGLPLVFLLKTLILLFAILLGLQGIAQAARAWLTLFGGAPADRRH
jgi:hypothetical protein